MADQWEELLRQEEQLRRDREVREQVFGHYGRACACCGAVKGLTIDHVNGDGKAHRAELSGDFYAWLIRKGCPPGFQVLCIPCNSSKGTGSVCKMHDETRNLKKMWLALSREQRIAFLAWIPELDPDRDESIWGEPQLVQSIRSGNVRRLIAAERPVTAAHEPPEDSPDQAEPDQAEPDQAEPAATSLALAYWDFRDIAAQIEEDDLAHIHPARRRMRELLMEPGSRGWTVGALARQLATEAQGAGDPAQAVHRNTLHTWLKKDEELGRVRRKGRAKNDPYAQWTWIRQPDA